MDVGHPIDHARLREGVVPAFDEDDVRSGRHAGIFPSHGRPVPRCRAGDVRSMAVGIAFTDEPDRRAVEFIIDLRIGVLHTIGEVSGHGLRSGRGERLVPDPENAGLARVGGLPEVQMCPIDAGIEDGHDHPFPRVRRAVDDAAGKGRGSGLRNAHIVHGDIDAAGINEPDGREPGQARNARSVCADGCEAGFDGVDLHAGGAEHSRIRSQDDEVILLPLRLFLQQVWGFPLGEQLLKEGMQLPLLRFGKRGCPKGQGKYGTQGKGQRNAEGGHQGPHLK